MGVSQIEYSQPFSGMQKALKERLLEQFEKYGEEFNLEDVTYPSFVKVDPADNPSSVGEKGFRRCICS